MKIPFTEYSVGKKEVVPPFFPPNSAINFSSYQIALQSALELLGTRTDATPVVTSVLASPQTMSAILRAGAQPLILDVDPATYHIDSTIVKSVLEDLSGMPVIFVIPDVFGTAPDVRLQEAIKGYPTIYASMYPPVELASFADFSVYDLSVLTNGPAGLLHTKHTKQVKDLIYIRSGEMGHSAELHSKISECLLSVYQHYDSIVEENTTIYESYTKYLISLNINTSIHIKDSKSFRYCFPMCVGNARRVQAHLHSYDIETRLGFKPVHELSELRSRWVDTPNYPVADNLATRMICLPVNKIVRGHEHTIIDRILEVNNG